MIIGRTNIFAEKNSHINNLSKRQYYNISHLAREFIISNNISSLPICVNDLIKNNNWRVISYSKLKNLRIYEFEDIINENIGFTELTQNKNYIIFYDDSQPIPVQRFTICHEIGHIILNHFNVKNENKEQEANMFAARILMPMCILYECNISSVEELQNLCNVSQLSATYRFKRLQMLKKGKNFIQTITKLKFFTSLKIL